MKENVEQKVKNRRGDRREIEGKLMEIEGENKIGKGEVVEKSRDCRAVL